MIFSHKQVPGYWLPEDPRFPGTSNTLVKERVVQHGFVAWVKKNFDKDTMVLHLRTDVEKGVPDLLIGMEGFSLVMEMKKWGEKPTPLQFAFLTRFRNAGYMTGWAMDLMTAADFMLAFEATVHHPTALCTQSCIVRRHEVYFHQLNGSQKKVLTGELSVDPLRMMAHRS